MFLLFFSPEASYVVTCVGVGVRCVCVCVRACKPRACPRHNSKPLQARTARGQRYKTSRRFMGYYKRGLDSHLEIWIPVIFKHDLHTAEWRPKTGIGLPSQLTLQIFDIWIYNVFTLDLTHYLWHTYLMVDLHPLNAQFWTITVTPYRAYVNFKHWTIMLLTSCLH